MSVGCPEFVAMITFGNSKVQGIRQQKPTSGAEVGGTLEGFFIDGEPLCGIQENTVPLGQGSVFTFKSADEALDPNDTRRADQ